MCFEIEILIILGPRLPVVTYDCRWRSEYKKQDRLRTYNVTLMLVVTIVAVEKHVLHILSVCL
jgi:hypothetical protein